jgi:hypothetical protein
VERMPGDKITLYHGTTRLFDKIDLSRGKAYKDFGIGFYAMRNVEHAENLALRNLRIERERLTRVGGSADTLFAYLYTYEFDASKQDTLKYKEFVTADREWLKFVICNRMSGMREHDFDLVIGPTANDNTRTSIRAITNAANGGILTDAALDLLIMMLEPENLPMQHYFGADRAVRLLTFKERSVIK